MLVLQGSSHPCIEKPAEKCNLIRDQRLASVDALQSIIFIGTEANAFLVVDDRGMQLEACLPANPLKKPK